MSCANRIKSSTSDRARGRLRGSLADFGDGAGDMAGQGREKLGDLPAFARLDVAVGAPAVAVLGGHGGVHIGAGGGDVGDVEGRHFLAPRFRLAARPPSFIDGERNGAS